MDHDAASCPRGQWSAPAPLLAPPGSARAVLRSAALVADEKNLFVVGNQLPNNDQPVRVGTTFSAWRFGHGLLGAPASDLVFVTPRATLDATGRLHVVWGEPPEHGQTIAPFQWLNLATSSIWTAVFEPDGGWSSPRQIYSGAIGWNPKVMSGAITRSADGESLIALPKDDGGVLVFALQNGEWTATAVPIPGVYGPAYVSVLGLGDRRLLVVVQADTTQKQDRNSVFLYAQDRDGPWRLVRQVQRSGRQAAMEVRLVAASRGRVHLVWRQMIREDYFVIRHVESNDEGTSWTEPSDLMPGGLIQNVEAAVDSCGQLHVVYEDWNERSFDAVRIGYASWDGGWSAPQRLHPGYVGAEPTLVPRTDGSLLLAFVGRSATEAEASKWATLYSELR